jgi:redox-sensitive bicupin YhaK (pirin superfamily)
MGKSEVIRPHEWQRMTAGTGVRHSEMNASKTEPVHFLQIWIMPEAENIRPGYEQKLFAPEEKSGRLRLVASRDGREGSLKIHQDVSVYNALLKGGEAVEHRLEPGRHAWLQVVKGTVELNGTRLGAGDGAAVSEESTLTISAGDDSEVILFDLA